MLVRNENTLVGLAERLRALSDDKFGLTPEGKSLAWAVAGKVDSRQLDGGKPLVDVLVAHQGKRGPEYWARANGLTPAEVVAGRAWALPLVDGPKRPIYIVEIPRGRFLARGTFFGAESSFRAMTADEVAFEAAEAVGLSAADRFAARAAASERPWER